MKKHIVLLLGSIIVLGLFGCNGFYVKEHLKHEYAKNLSFFDSSLVSHFPKRLPDIYIFSTNVSLSKIDYKKETGFFNFYTDLRILYSNKEYSKIKKMFSSSSKAIYNANSKNLLLIFSYSNELEVDGKIYTDWESPERQKLAKHNLLATSLPVPLFEIDEYHGNTLSGLPVDFKIYVLEAKPGKYLDEKYLHECSCLPAKWKHGFSRGVAVSDKRKVVIYWVTVW